MTVCNVQFGSGLNYKCFIRLSVQAQPESDFVAPCIFNFVHIYSDSVALYSLNLAEA